MIRREIRQAGDHAGRSHGPTREPRWALISQVEHARLAADLARNWKHPLLPPELREGREAALAELLAAIDHHDDGWAEWEQAPGLDPVHGRPRSFTEMPQDDSLAIWSKSIAIAEQIGPLAAWVVAGHFMALLSRGNSDATPGNEAEAAADWLQLMEARRADWLKTWLSAAPGRTAAAAEWGLESLQFFDAVSLWICCVCPAEGEEPRNDDQATTVTFADGTPFEFRDDDRAENSRDKTSPCGHITPWPLSVEKLIVSASARSAPIRHYDTTDELLQAWRPCRLTWHLSPLKNA